MLGTLTFKERIRRIVAITTKEKKMATEPDASHTQSERKGGYHHGQLREALIDAAHHLIAEGGPEGFTLADTCRAAGVSTAAPYRHFADRGALLQAVAARGFAMLAERTRAARDAGPKGSVESIVGMGRAYVGFAADEPTLFKLMFGRHPDVQPEGTQHVAGKGCFTVLLEAVAAWIERHEQDGLTVMDVALPLWTIVHGTSYLLIDRDFDATAPGTDADALVERATVAMLAGLQSESRRG